MDRREAARLLRHELTSYARRSRADLTDLIGRVEAYSVEGSAGVAYQVEIDAHWDSKPGGTIRVLGSIDDGGLRSSFSPTTDDFLMDVDGVVDMADLEASG
jgi:hypothetical protein